MASNTAVWGIGAFLGLAGFAWWKTTEGPLLTSPVITNAKWDYPGTTANGRLVYNGERGTLLNVNEFTVLLQTQRKPLRLNGFQVLGTLLVDGKWVGGPKNQPTVYHDQLTLPPHTSVVLRGGSIAIRIREPLPPGAVSLGVSVADLNGNVIVRRNTPTIAQVLPA